MWPRILPFAAYMAFIGVSTFLPSDTIFELWLYPLKILVVMALLMVFWTSYQELQQPVIANGKEAAFTVGAGVLVYVLWIQMDWNWAVQGEPAGYNPFQEGAPAGFLLAGIRIFGAAVIVPFMEELFWRSFLMRWIINPDAFEHVPIGMFTLGSFAITVVLFGLEHHLWLAGMMAGAIYNGLLYHTKRLWPCVLAHGITNLLLGIHVLVTGEWQWW